MTLSEFLFSCLEKSERFQKIFFLSYSFHVRICITVKNNFYLIHTEKVFKNLIKKIIIISKNSSNKYVLKIYFHVLLFFY